jgi:hypothetical protein
VRYRTVIAFLLLSAANATVITSTDCSVTLGISTGKNDSGPNACSVILTDASGTLNLARAIASSTASVVIPSTAAGAFGVSINESILLNTGASPFGATSGSVNAFADVSFVLTSLGPTRAGVLSVLATSTLPISAPFDEITGGATVTAGPLTGACGVYVSTCSGIFSGGKTSITLGAPFVLDVTQMLHGTGFGGDGANWGGGTQVSVRLFESDGVTPVAIQLSPEPASCLTGALGLAVLLVLRRKIAQR